MGIYQGTNRIDSVNVGSKDMVVLLQDNHILALGTKYWAVDLGTLSWSTPSAIGNSYAKIDNAKIGAISYLAGYERQNGATNMPNGTSGFNSSQQFFYLTNSDFIGKSATDVANALSGVYMVYEFNRTLYNKLDLGSLNWEYYEGYDGFITTDLVDLVKPPADNNTKANISVLSYENVSNYYFDSNVTIDKLICVAYNSTCKVRMIGTTNPNECKRKLKGITILYEQLE